MWRPATSSNAMPSPTSSRRMASFEHQTSWKMFPKKKSSFKCSIFSHLHIVFPIGKHRKTTCLPQDSPQFSLKKGGKSAIHPLDDLVDGRGQQPLSTIRGASRGSTGDLQKKNIRTSQRMTLKHQNILVCLIYNIYIYLYLFIYLFIQFVIYLSIYLFIY